MLSIKPIGSSKEEVGYYATLGSEDYYVKGSEPPGSWWGEGAFALGLEGTVGGAKFRNLLLGLSPDGEQKLVQNACDPKRRSAFDLTFSVPKSVSALWGASRETERLAIQAASERALHATLQEFDRLCTFTRNGKLGIESEKAEPIAAIFKHETARAVPGSVPDPNLHFHVVVLNAVLREDGRSGALDARPLFERHMKMALGALFRAELSKELEALGLSSHRATKTVAGRTKELSWFELDCVPEGLLKVFSKRREAIEGFLKRKGLSGAKAAEFAALATREGKKAISRDELFVEWERVARECGLSPQVIGKVFEAFQERNVAAECTLVVAKSLKRITDERAHFTELELLRFAAEEAQARGLGIAEVKDSVASALLSPSVVRLTDQDEKPRFTTQEMLTVETRMLRRVEDSRENSSHALSGESVAEVLRSFKTLSAQQREAVRHITLGEDSVSCVNGLAGTGKTFMLSIAREAWEREGFRVLGVALAAKAAQALEDGSGIESTHLHRLFHELDQRARKLSSPTVVVLDEAGMVGTRHMERLLTEVGRVGAKLVLVGDHRQLQAIDAGAPFKAIADRLGCAELTGITRQRESWTRDAVVEFSEGKAASALSRFAARGLLSVSPDREEAMSKLVSDWAKVDTSSALIFAGTNLDVLGLNRLCQEKRLDKGELGEDSLRVGNYAFHVGDRVMFTRNERALLVKNGMTGVVTEVNGARSYLRVAIDGGLSILVDTQRFDDLALGYAVTTHKGQGQTVENAFVLTGGPMTDRELSYVQASRARGETRIYTDLLSGGDNLERLARQMSRSNAKDLAHDYLLCG